MRREMHQDQRFRLRDLSRQAGIQKQTDGVHGPVQFSDVGEESLLGLG